MCSDQNAKKLYVQESQAKVTVEVQVKDVRKKFAKVNDKLQEYEKREVSMQSLRRAVNEAEFRVEETKKEITSLTVERDRAMERFVM